MPKFVCAKCFFVIYDKLEPFSGLPFKCPSCDNDTFKAVEVKVCDGAQFADLGFKLESLGSDAFVRYLLSCSFFDDFEFDLVVDGFIPEVDCVRSSKEFFKRVMCGYEVGVVSFGF